MVRLTGDKIILYAAVAAVVLYGVAIPYVPSASTVDTDDSSCLRYETERVKDKCVHYDYTTKTVTECTNKVLFVCLNRETKQVRERDGCAEWTYTENRVCAEWANDNTDSVVSTGSGSDGDWTPDDGSSCAWWEFWCTDSSDTQTTEQCEQQREPVCMGQEFTSKQTGATGQQYTGVKITNEDCTTEREKRVDCVNKHDAPHVCNAGKCVRFQQEITIQALLSGIGLID